MMIESFSSLSLLQIARGHWDACMSKTHHDILLHQEFLCRDGQGACTPVDDDQPAGQALERTEQAYRGSQ